MFIERNKEQLSLKKHQKPYLEILVSKFCLSTCKATNVPLVSHFQLSKEQCLRRDANMIKWEKIPDVNVIGSIVFAMIILDQILPLHCLC